MAGGANCEDGEMFELLQEADGTSELLQAEGANCGEANETSELLQTREEADEIFESLSVQAGRANCEVGEPELLQAGTMRWNHYDSFDSVCPGYEVSYTK